MLNKVRGVANLVERVLRNHPEARDSDMELLYFVWREQGFYMTPEQRDMFRDLANPESIRRNRQKLQERGKYLGSEKVRKERQHKALEMQQAMPAHKPKYHYDPLANTMRMF